MCRVERVRIASTLTATVRAAAAKVEEEMGMAAVEKVGEGVQVVETVMAEGVRETVAASGSALASRSSRGSHSTIQMRCHSTHASTAPAAQTARAKKSILSPWWASLE